MNQLLLIIVLGAVFLLIVALALFFWKRVNSHNFINGERGPFLRRFSRSTSRQNQQSNNIQDTLTSNNTDEHIEQLQLPQPLPVNTAMSNLSNAPPSYAEVRLSTTEFPEPQETLSTSEFLEPQILPPSYRDVMTASQLALNSPNGAPSSC